MTKRRRIALISVLLVLAGLAGAWIYFSARTLHYSNPALVRTNPGYATAHSEPKERPAMPDGFFEHFQFQESSNQIVVIMPVTAVETVEVDAAAADPRGRRVEHRQDQGNRRNGGTGICGNAA